MRAVMALSSTQAQGARGPIQAENRRRQRVSCFAMPCDGDTTDAKGSSPDDAALDWSGRTVPHGRQGWTSLLVSTFGGPTRPRSPLRRCFSRVSPLENGVSRFRFRLPVAVLRKKELPQAVVRPVVRIPIDRHVATARANLGRAYVVSAIENSRV
jgi:hypothetical protein